MPTYLVHHVTTYRYKSPVAFGEHRLLLRPRESFDQKTIGTRLQITPEPSEVTWAEDASGNLVGRCRFTHRARELRFDSTIEVEQEPYDPAALRLSQHARTAPFSYDAEEAPELARFIERQHVDPDHLTDGFARRILAEDPAGDTFAFLVRLNSSIRRDFAYLRREEAGLQHPATTLRLRRGSCRDFAVLIAEAARSLGLAARFVSGYLHVRADNHALAVAGGHTHAWLQVYLPGGGWVDFDPTSGAVGNRDLVRVAAVRDPRQAAPIAGSFIGFPGDFLRMDVGVSVTEADKPARPLEMSPVSSCEAA